MAGRCPILEAMTSPEFSITVTGSPRHPVVEVAGEIDYHRGLSLAERVDGLLAGQPSHVTLDLSGVGFCASGTVSALVAGGFPPGCGHRVMPRRDAT